jgi:hypothetical protein
MENWSGFHIDVVWNAVWNTVRIREMDHPLTQGESRRIQVGQSKEETVKERFWWM